MPAFVDEGRAAGFRRRDVDRRELAAVVTHDALLPSPTMVYSNKEVRRGMSGVPWRDPPGKAGGATARSDLQPPLRYRLEAGAEPPSRPTPAGAAARLVGRHEGADGPAARLRGGWP